MASLSQKISFIEKRITQKELADLVGSSPRYIRFIKSKEKSGKLYEPAITEIYENLKSRKSPPSRKYAEGETAKLRKDLKSFKSEIEYKKPVKQIKRTSIQKVNKRKEKYVFNNLIFNIPFIKNIDYIYNKIISEVSKYKFTTIMSVLHLKEGDVKFIEPVETSTSLDGFKKNLYSALILASQGKDLYLKRHVKAQLMKGKKIIYLINVWLRIYI